MAYFEYKPTKTKDTAEGKIYAMRLKGKYGIAEPEENEYDKQANNFLKDTKTNFTIKKIGHGKYFPDDKEERDIYKFTLVKDGKSYSGRFGQSIDGTQKGETPTAYDVLSSLSGDMGEEENYEEFADNYGYDRDSHSGRQIFKAVQKERAGLKNLYSQDELEKLGEIR